MFLYKINENIKVDKIEEIEVPRTNRSALYRWVGGILGEDNNIYGIPTEASGVLKIDTKTGKYKILKSVSHKPFKYTGGGYYSKDGCIYGFPRTSNSLLKIDCKEEKVEEIRLDTNYDLENGEHHYGGAIYNDTIYLSPRSANHILAINLEDYSTKKIAEGEIPKGYRYSGGILNYDGKIYFYPNSTETRTMVLDPETEKVEFIGDAINCYCYGASIASNGCIYGYSCYSSGILKINTKTKEVSRILDNEVESGFFGSEIGVNGKIYSVPGTSNKIYEFDPKTETVKLIYEINDDNGKLARCAGGGVDDKGNIWFMPAKGDKIYKLNFTKHKYNYRQDVLNANYLNNY